jgi:hypothetical protein
MGALIDRGQRVGSIRRRGITAAALALTLLSGGCAGSAEQPPPTLRVGYDSLDGTLQVWPPRGGLASDPGAAAAVGRAVAAWRTPVRDRVHLPSSGILWLGEVDAAPLALVAANVPGGSASWLLQLTRREGGPAFQVSHATEYTDPGYLVYSDVLPVELPTGRHYLTSARVQRLLGPDNAALPSTDGLTGPVDVPSCAAVPLSPALRVTESLPAGKTADRLLDLGTGIEDPRYPLVGDESGSGRKALDGLDTCALAAKTGPFGSIPRRSGDRDEPHSVPTSWPIDRIATSSLGAVSLDTPPPVQIDQLSWRTDAGTMTAIVLRPETGPPVPSPADRMNPLQAYVVTVAGRDLAVLVWKSTPDTTLSVPPGTARLVDLPGLVVVPKPAVKQTFILAGPDKPTYRSVGGRS